MKKSLRGIRSLLLWGMLLSLSGRLAAQESLPVLNFPNNKYKAQLQNWSVSQSKDRFVYAGNSDGLLEFDGSQWQLYPLPNGQITRVVHCDGPRIYVGGYGEFGYWEKEANGALRYHSLSKTGKLPSIQTEEIWHILKTPEHIYFQSFSYIYRYSPASEADSTGRKQPVLKELRAPSNFMFLHRVQNRILVQLIHGGLYELQEERFTLLPGTTPLEKTSVSAILPFPGNEILIATVNDGLFLWKGGQLRPWRTEAGEMLSKNLLNKGLRLQNGHYAFGTLLDGVYIISEKGAVVNHFSRQNGLQNNSVLGMHEDQDHNLWLALDKGIDLVSLSSPVSLYKNDQVPLETTYAIAYWKNHLYVGSNLGLFRKKWPGNDPFELVPGLQGQVWELRVFDDMLLCGHNEGTFLVTPSGARKISSEKGGWITLRTEGNGEPMLIQGTYTGLCAYRKNSAGVWVFAHKIRNSPPVPIKYMVMSDKRTLWMAHAYKGLFRAELSDDASEVTGWTEIPSPSVIPDPNNVEVISWQGRLLVRSGTRFFTAAPDGSLLPYEGFGTAEEHPFKIRNGAAGEWFKVYRNRVRLERTGQPPYDIRFPLVRNYETVTPITGRYYFFCTENGYYIFDRMRADSRPDDPAPVLRRISSLHDPARRFPLRPNEVIPAGIRDLRMVYSLPVFEKEALFRYRLKGLSDRWSEWTDQPYADFTNLPAGSFTFELQHSLGKSTLSYPFEIAPKWHETGGVRLLAFCFAVAAFSYFIFLQEQRMQRQRERLIREHEEMLRRKEEANEKRIMEIRNEQLSSEVKSKSQQLSNIAINVVRKNEILEEIKTELIQVKQDLGQQLPNIHYQKLLDSINRNVSGKEDWKLFEDNFNEVHEEFFNRLKKIHPSVSPGELRLAAALRMNLSSKEIAPILGISIRGVEIKRYRLRKKLGLDEETNLNEYMMQI